MLHQPPCLLGFTGGENMLSAWKGTIRLIVNWKLSLSGNFVTQSEERNDMKYHYDMKNYKRRFSINIE